MLSHLTIEGLGVFLWVYASLSVYRLNFLGRLDHSLVMGQASVDFLVVLSFYVIGSKLSGAHLNPVVSLGLFLLAEITLPEVP